MRALTWQGNEKVEVIEVPDPVIEEPTDAIIKVTSTAICGSDLHLYSVLGSYLSAGDVLGHESMGIVEAVGAEVTHIQPGDRVVIPFNISCGHCWMCTRGLYPPCETTQDRTEGKGAALFGYTSLYGTVPRGRRSICEFRRLSSGRSRSRPRDPMSSTSTYRTSCRPLCKPSSTPTRRARAPWQCLASVRSASSALGSLSISVSPGLSGWSRCRNGGPRPNDSAWKPSIHPTSATSLPPSSTLSTVADRTLSSTRSGWRRTATTARPATRSSMSPRS